MIDSRIVIPYERALAGGSESGIFYIMIKTVVTQECTVQKFITFYAYGLCTSVFINYTSVKREKTARNNDSGRYHGYA
jgi:hypothetical protein